MFGMIKYPPHQISINKNMSIPIKDDQTVEDMEMYAKKKFGLNSLNFYTYDGALISKGTETSTFLSLPYFKLVLDGSKEYIVISEKSFSFQNHKFELEPNAKQVYDYCKNIEVSDENALILSKYSSVLLDELQKQNKWTKQQFLDRACALLVCNAHQAREEQSIIRSKYDLLKTHRKPLDEVKSSIEKTAELYAKRKIFSLFGVIFSQYLLVQYGTYIMFSWDIMEPLTCAMTLGDAVIAYLFWAWTKTSYSMSGVFQYYYNKKKAKLAKKENFDEEQYDKIQSVLKIMKKRLNELK